MHPLLIPKKIGSQKPSKQTNNNKKLYLVAGGFNPPPSDSIWDHLPLIPQLSGPYPQLSGPYPQLSGPYPQLSGPYTAAIGTMCYQFQGDTPSRDVDTPSMEKSTRLDGEIHQVGWRKICKKKHKGLLGDFLFVHQHLIWHIGILLLGQHDIISTACLSICCPSIVGSKRKKTGFRGRC